MNAFSKKEIESSIQRFTDLSNDLQRSNYDTFNDKLSQFFHFAENDKVFKYFHVQLIHNPNTDIDGWYNDKLSKRSSAAGSAPFEFPKNNDDRLSIQYQLVYSINSKKIYYRDFMVNFFSSYNGISTFIEAVLNPLFRELNYKIIELLEKLNLDASTPIEPDKFQITNNGNDVIQQIIIGDDNKAIIKNITKRKEILNHLSNIRDILKENLIPDEANVEFSKLDTIEREIESGKAQKTTIEFLLKSLPPIGSIASIISAILSLI